MVITVVDMVQHYLFVTERNAEFSPLNLLLCAVMPAEEHADKPVTILLIMQIVEWKIS